MRSKGDRLSAGFAAGESATLPEGEGEASFLRVGHASTTRKMFDIFRKIILCLSMKKTFDSCLILLSMTRKEASGMKIHPPFSLGIHRRFIMALLLL